MKLLAFALPVFFLLSCFSSKKTELPQTNTSEPCSFETAGIIVLKPCFFSDGDKLLQSFNDAGLSQAEKEGRIITVLGSVTGKPHYTKHGNGGVTVTGTQGSIIPYHVAVVRWE